MTENSQLKLILAKSRPPTPVIFMTWLIFIVIPIFSIPIVANRLLKMSEKHLEDEVRLELMEEMNAYINELEPSAFLQKIFAKHIGQLEKHSPDFWKNIAKESFAGKSRKFKADLEKAIGTRISGLIWHDQNLKEWHFDIGSEWERTPSKYAMSRILLSTLSPEMKERYQIDNNRVSGFKKQILGDITDAQITEGVVNSLVSNRFSGGRIYLFYRNLQEKSAMEPGKGVFISVRERDLKPHLLLNTTAAGSLKNGFTRKWELIPASKNRSLLENRRKSTLFNFSSNEQGIHIISRPGHSFLSFMVFGGKLGLPLNTGNICLRVSSSPTATKHPLRSLEHLLKFLLRLFLLSGSLVFIYIFLFGFASKADIGKKILAALSGVALFPFCMLFLTLLFSLHLKFSHSLNSAKNQLEFSRLAFNAMVRNHRLELKSRFWKSMRSLQATDGRVESIRQSLSQIHHSFPSKEIFGISAFDKEFEVNIDESSRRAFSAKALLAMKAMVKRLRQGFLSNDAIGEQKNTSLDHMMGHKFSMGDYIANSNEFLRLTMGTNRYLFTGGACRLTNDKNNRLKVISVLINCPVQRLIKDFFRWNRGNLIDLEKQKIPWQINGFAVSDNDYRISDTESMHWKTKTSISEEMLTSFAGMQIQNEQLHWSSRFDKSTRLHTVFPLADLNLKIYLWIDVPNTAFPRSFWGATMLFLIALFIFIRLLLRSTFQGPVLLFAEHARKIQNGQYPDKIAISGTDEIGRLGESFSQMVQGLKQRDELANYVSDEVIETVRDEKAGSLAPGGEMINAAVIFLSLKGFADWATKNETANSVAVLNNFLDFSSRIAAKYDGTLDKIIEDTLMLVFRQKNSTNDFCFNAVKSALQIQKELPAQLKDIYGKVEDIPCKAGLSTGKVLSGKIGSAKGTLDFSVIGNTVNLASRLKAFADSAPTSGIIVCPITVKTVAREVKFKFLNRVRVKGRTKQFSIFEVLELREQQK